jgi:hypothetical protein
MTLQTMNVDYNSLNEIFRTQDFLGLIAVGAPETEYKREVEDIWDALESLPREEATVSRFVGIFEDIYRLRFNWSDEQMRRVRPDFEDVAHKVMNYFA